MCKKFFIFALMLVWHLTMVAQSNTLVKGDLLLLLQDEKDIPSITRELGYLNGIKTNFQLKQVVSPSMHIYLFTFDFLHIPGNEFLNTLRQHPLIKVAQFNHTIQERATPNDSLFSYLWNLQNNGDNDGIVGNDIDAVKAWDFAKGGVTIDGDTIVIAIVDYGFDLSHKDLNYWKNYQEIPGNGIDDDGNGYVDDYKGWNSLTKTDAVPLASHGTHVSGIAGARGNNRIGVTGVSWEVKTMAISYGSGAGLESNAIAAYSYIRDQRKLYNQSNGQKGAFVVCSNSSFGMDTAKANDHPLWCAMYDSLGAVGVLSAGATANRNLNVDAEGDIPTTCTSNWLITVTNTTNKDEKNQGAAYGKTHIDLGAPGTNIVSTFSGNNYALSTGTSMATPHITGTVALMLSAACSTFMKAYKTNPAGMSLVIKDSLLNAVDVIPSLSAITASRGRLNLFKSVSSIKHYCGVNTFPTHDDHFTILNVYPVPTFGNEITVDYTCDREAEIDIISTLGQEIIRIPCKISEEGIIQHAQFQLAGISKGVYFIRLRSSNKIKVVKIIF